MCSSTAPTLRLSPQSTEMFCLRNPLPRPRLLTRLLSSPAPLPPCPPRTPTKSEDIRSEKRRICHSTISTALEAAGGVVNPASCLPRALHRPALCSTQYCPWHIPSSLAKESGPLAPSFPPTACPWPAGEHLRLGQAGRAEGLRQSRRV